MGKSLTRRIIALIFAICGAGVMSYLAIRGVSEAFVSLVASVGMVLGYYFGTQANKL